MSNFFFIVVGLVSLSLLQCQGGLILVEPASPIRDCDGVKQEKSKARGTNPTIATWPKYPKGFIRIPYAIGTSLSLEAIPSVEYAIYLFKKYTCISLEPKVDSDQDYVMFQDNPLNEGGWSYLGMLGGRQELNLSDGCYQSIGIVLHEIAHALGIHHEQSRPDRDDYVTIYFENIEPDKTNNFEKEESINSFNSPYDFLSMMHYSSTAFAKTDTYSMLKKDGSVIPWQQNGFSELDIEQINKLYNCNGVTETYSESTTCYHAYDKGLSYRGTAKTYTINGTSFDCDPWDKHKNVLYFYIHDLKENYCRNTNPAFYTEPMCLVRQGEKVYYAYCDVPQCTTTHTTTTTALTTTPATSTTPVTTTTTTPATTTKPTTTTLSGALSNLPTILVYIIVLLSYIAV